MSLQRYHSFLLNEKCNRYRAHIFKADRLFQDYLCIAFASIGNQNLKYARFNEDSLRSDVNANLEDAVIEADTSVGKLGQCIICPKYITGSYLHWHARFLEYLSSST